MKNSLFFRILGALASGLLVFSVFVPFSNSSSTTLWDIWSQSDGLYVPIMIISFGILSVLLFASNIKVELVYLSVGASLFYSIMQTISTIKQDLFGELGMGYYFLLIGTVIMFIMTFICTLRSKNKTETVNVQTNEEKDILSRIDSLYNDNQTQPQQIQPITPISTVDVPNLEPVSAQPLSSVEPIPEITEVVPNNNIPNVANPQLPEQSASILNSSIPNPVTNEFNSAPVALAQPQISVAAPLTNANPVTQEFVVEPTQQQEVIVQQPVQPQTIPVQQTQMTPVTPTPVVPIQPIGAQSVTTQPVNPVVSEFTQPEQQTQVSTSNQVPTSPASPAPVSNTVGMDIFGSTNSNM